MLGLSVALALAGCAQAPAPTATAPAATAVLAAPLTAEAEDALRRMSATLAAAPAFTMRVRTLRGVVLEDGQEVLVGATSAVVARRPDRLLAVIGSDAGNISLWYDGTRATVLDPVRNTYASTPLSGDMVGAADWLEEQLGFSLPVRPLLAADPYAAMMEAGPTSGRVLGRSVVGDAVVQHIALRNPLVDWEVWLEDTPRALPRRVSVVERRGPAPVRMTIEIEQWDLSPRVTDRAFTFVPPRGATEAAFAPGGATQQETGR